MRVVIDLNVFVSSLISKSGYPAQIIDFVRKGDVKFLYTNKMVARCLQVLNRDKVVKKYKITPRDITNLKRLFDKVGIDVTDKSKKIININISPDPEDNEVIRCGIAGNAKYIITGNTRDFKSVKNKTGINVISPTDFIRLMRKVN